MNPKPGKLMDAGTTFVDAIELSEWSGFDERTAAFVMREIDTAQRGYVTTSEVWAYIEAHTVEETPTSVYIARDKKGVCVYVGITGKGSRRLHDHQKASAWWRKAHTIELEHLKSRAKAEAREIELIQTLHPVYNVQHRIAA